MFMGDLEAIFSLTGVWSGRIRFLDRGNCDSPRLYGSVLGVANIVVSKNDDSIRKMKIRVRYFRSRYF